MSLIASNLCLKSDTEYHLNDVCFEMSKGEIYTIIGRTLAGKTTLLKTIAGLIAPESGSLTLDGAKGRIYGSGFCHNWIGFGRISHGGPAV